MSDEFEEKEARIAKMLAEDERLAAKVKEQFGIVCDCRLKVVDGHIEAECETKEASHELAELLEKEVIIRVKPVKVTEEEGG